VLVGRRRQRHRSRLHRAGSDSRLYAHRSRWVGSSPLGPGAAL
jgi:hypothetical protein